ncbi:hypothetical protein Tsubulata_033522 [Turnera subulata]|uniref:DUF1517 domain-containing protein n=1 Tax=Turnera subulata TaxID=218843 RepID=A0A9Q0F7C4_9ROSI|nr:hypothetical protein Tsubulata_033522 [Turnera subulata]
MMMAFNLAPKAPFLTHALLILLVSSCSLLWVSQAASGGSMGGSSFSSGGSSSSSSGSSSFSSGGSNYYYVDDDGRYNGPSGAPSDYGPNPAVIILPVLAGIGLVTFVVFYWVANRSVVMVQIGLLGKARSLQEELNQIARSTNTSSSYGWHQILRATTSALVRNSHYFVSCRSSVKNHMEIESAGETFKRLAAKERAKFDIESLVNVNNVKIQREVFRKASKDSKDYIVVTIIVATDCGRKCRIPRIKSKDDLKNALEYLNSFIQDSRNLLGVEVLWSPQIEEDTLTEKELLVNYPRLKPIP